MSKRRRIMVFVDWFEPGFKAGGPIRSCVNFAFHMQGEYDVFVFTGDRDHGDVLPYKDVPPDRWVKRNEWLQVFYASPASQTWSTVASQVREIGPDFIYLNSMFSIAFAIYPMMMKRLGRINAKMILAPRGMLKNSALSFKPVKKKLYLGLLNRLGVPAKINFHATDVTEVADIRLHFGHDSRIDHISNFPGVQKTFREPPEKKHGFLKVVFVGRIHPIKNLYFLLQCLKQVEGSISLTIVAAIEDREYWASCQELIGSFPSNLTVLLRHDVEHAEVETIIRDHHLFMLPTSGENFGHAIFEALAAGRPVLISDQTPWRNLEEIKAGWDLSLGNQAGFTEALQKAVDMDHEELLTWCKNAWSFCQRFISGSDIKQQYLKLFS